MPIARGAERICAKLGWRGALQEREGEIQGEHSICGLVRCVSCFLQIKINPFMLKDIQHLSAFKKFEIECCQLQVRYCNERLHHLQLFSTILQKLNIIGMNANERALFFTNIYNMLISKCLRLHEIAELICLLAHGIIRRGVGGAGVIDRHTSRRTTKYNIGGFIFSLIDVSLPHAFACFANTACQIKYGILRATTTSIVVGPVSLDWNFAGMSVSCLAFVALSLSLVSRSRSSQAIFPDRVISKHHALSVPSLRHLSAN